MRILLVEDDPGLCNTLERGLGESGNVVDVTHDGKAGIFYAQNVEYDTIILDVMLPDINGVEVCRALRAGGVSTPVLMLTAKNTLEDKIKGLDAGADDYMIKPFDFEELEARLRALQRRQAPYKSPVIEVSGILLDTAAREVTVNGKTVEMTTTEYRILEYLMMNPNQVLTRDMIEEHIWKIEKTHQSNAVDVFIGKLRHKLGYEARSGPIQTIHGKGYRLKT